ncbi:hypothetical protein H0H87_002209 [Tephrocybe sp. NHM501043]|nr:hypothetical protein H0H87_002209 [Tephrocybe sp. NHM501043]
MVSSPIAVGRVLVDPDHADVARSLLSVESVLAGMDPVDDQTKKKNPVTDNDEDYARRIQEHFLRDALQTMEDYRYARSVAANNESYPATTIVHGVALDHLRALFAISHEGLDPEPDRPTVTTVSEYVLIRVFLNLPHKFESSMTALNTADDSDDDCYAKNVIDDEDYIDHPASPRDAAAAAAEYRKARLALSISMGLPGPSSCGSGLVLEDRQTYFDDSRVPSPSGLSRSSTDPGDPVISSESNYRPVDDANGMHYKEIMDGSHKYAEDAMDDQDALPPYDTFVYSINCFIYSRIASTSTLLRFWVIILVLGLFSVCPAGILWSGSQLFRLHAATISA